MSGAVLILALGLAACGGAQHGGAAAHAGPRAYRSADAIALGATVRSHSVPVPDHVVYAIR